MVRFESALERDCITVLARLPGFHRIEGQPIAVRFTQGGRLRRYTPDFLVTFGVVPATLARLGFAEETYVEVKYADQATADRALIAARLDAVERQTGRPARLLDETVLRTGGVLA